MSWGVGIFIKGIPSDWKPFLSPEWYTIERRVAFMIWSSVISLLGVLGLATAYLRIPEVKYVFLPSDVVDTAQNVEALSPRTLHTFTGPILTYTRVQQWVGRAIKESFSFNFLEYERQLNDISVYFTKPGWAAFEPVVRAKIINTVAEDRLSVWMTPLTPPTVTKSFLVGTTQYWIVEMKILLSYRGDIPTQSQRLLLQVHVESQPAADNPYGMGIFRLRFVSSPD